MTGNASLFIMRKADVDKNGYLEQVDITRMAVEDPISYQLLEDLYNFEPDFMDKHRQILSGAGTKPLQGSASFSHKPQSQLRNSMRAEMDQMQV